MTTPAPASGSHASAFSNGVLGDQVLVVGLGGLGRPLARALAAQGVQVFGIDREQERVEELDLAGAVADASSVEDLAASGASDSTAAVICLGASFGASVLATGYLVDHGVSPVWVAARDDRHERILRRVGAARVVHPRRDAALSIVASMTDVGSGVLRPAASTVVMTIETPRDLQGAHARWTALRVYGVELLAVAHHAGELVPIDQAPRVRAGDNLVISGPEERVLRLAALARSERATTRTAG